MALGVGSVVALSGVYGDIVEHYEYDVFGGATIRYAQYAILGMNDYNNPYMFTGRRYDSETGLYYYSAGCDAALYASSASPADNYRGIAAQFH